MFIKAVFSSVVRLSSSGLTCSNSQGNSFDIEQLRLVGVKYLEVTFYMRDGRARGFEVGDSHDVQFGCGTCFRCK